MWKTELKEQGIQPLQVEGYASSSWVLLDYGDVVVHIFTESDPGLLRPGAAVEGWAQLPFPIFFCRKRRIDARPENRFIFQKDLII